MKKIAIASEDLSFPLDEGFKKASVSLTLAIAARGRRVSVFARRAQGLPFAVHPLPANKFLAGQALGRALREAAPDAVLYIPEAAATPASLVRARNLAARAGGAPVAVLSLQRRRYPAWARPIVRRLAPRLLLVLSQATCDAAREAGLPAEVVPLGVDGLAFRPAEPGEKLALRHKYGIPEGQVVLHVGHISPSRNLELLRRTLAPGRHLVVVSSTTTQADPRVRRALEGASVIFLTQYIEHVEEIYRLADCYVFPTRQTGGAIEIPLSVLEAMATNLPVVTTDFGGLPGLFRDRPALEPEGLFLAATDGEFVEKLQPALACADVATRHMVRNLTWDRVAGEILERMDALTLDPSGGLRPLGGPGKAREVPPKVDS